MKNSDNPINPIPNDLRASDGSFDDRFSGLTKREYASMLALQGLLSNSYFPAVANIEEFPAKAISLADELLKQLETK